MASRLPTEPPRGIRIGEEPDRDGQYFHYLAMWLYALAVLGRHRPVIFAEVHSPALLSGCEGLLAAAGYRTSAIARTDDGSGGPVHICAAAV